MLVGFQYSWFPLIILKFKLITLHCQNEIILCVLWFKIFRRFLMCWLMKTTAHVHLRYFTVEWYPISSGMLILSFWDNTAVFSWLTRVISIVPRFFTQASLSWYLEQPRLSSLFDWLKFFIPLFSPIRSYHWKDSDVTVSIFPRYSLCNTDAFSHVGSVVLFIKVQFVLSIDLFVFIDLFTYLYLFT